MNRIDRITQGVRLCTIRVRVTFVYPNEFELKNEFKIGTKIYTPRLPTVLQYRVITNDKLGLFLDMGLGKTVLHVEDL